MKKYDDYKEDKSREDLTNEELSKIKWTSYKIIVPTEEDKQELMESFEHIHYSDVDSDYITVNSLMHEYLYGSNIIVDEKLFNKIK